MSSLIINDDKKVYAVEEMKTTVTVFDSPECKGEDTNCSNIGQSCLITESLSIEIAAIFDGHGGKEASTFLQYNFISCFTSSIILSSIPSLDELDELTSDNDDWNSASISMNTHIQTVYGDMYQAIINSGVLAVDNALCEHLKTLDLRGRDPGSTLSAWVNFITPIGNTSYLVIVGDSPAHALCKRTGVITSVKLHNIKDLSCQEDANQHSDIKIASVRNNHRIMDINIISEDVCTMVQSASMIYRKGLRIMNIPRCLGHFNWYDAMKKQPEIINVPSDADVIVLMSDGVSDMTVNVHEYMEKSTEMGWDVIDIGNFYKSRWYQPWKQQYNGVISEETQYIAIKGHEIHLADDMTIVQINIH